MELRAAILLSLALAGPAVGYPYGTPTTACSDMFPVGHNVSAQDSDAPYTITTSSNSYVNNVNVTVTLNIAGSDGYYEGVFIQARRAKCDANHDVPVGTFVIGQTERQRLTTLNCKSGTRNAVSHNTKAKKKMLTFTWMPPSQPVGTIYFRGTFVKETDEFWTTVSSDFLSHGTASTEGAIKCPVRTSGSEGLHAQAYYMLLFGATCAWFVTRNA